MAAARHRTIAHLGGGPLSDVVLAKRDPEAEGAALCVVKRLKLGADADPAVEGQFLAESRLAMRLHHPSIAESLESDQDADGPFLVLEYLEGQTLARIRSRTHRRKAGLPRGVALHIAIAIADGLAYAHALDDDKGNPLGIVHRDVTPENVVITYGGATKLIDFQMAARGEGAPRVSVAYCAPEQVHAGKELDARTDVFALGVILWELLARRRMWEGMTEAAVTKRLGESAPLPTLRSVVSDMPIALDDLCIKALALAPGRRFESAAAMRDALKAAAKDVKLEATNAQVAELVISLFEEEREKMRDLVDDALMRPVGGPPASIPQIRPLPPTSSNKLVDVETDPRLWVGSAPALAAPAKPVVQLQVVEVASAEPPRSDRRFAILTGAAVVVLLGGVAIYSLTAKAPKPDEPTPAIPTRAPTASAAAEPSALPEPEEIAIEIIVRPTTAKLLIDGVKQSNPYRTKVVPGKFPHEIRAEAEGFDPHVTSGVLFDRDRSIDIALVPKKPPPGVPGVRDAAAPHDAQ